MKGNRNDGMGMRQAVACLSSLKKDMLNCFPEMRGHYWEDEFNRILSQMRKRLKVGNKE